MKSLFLFIILFFSLPSLAERVGNGIKLEEDNTPRGGDSENRKSPHEVDRVGNGGSDVRGRFIIMGNRVISYLQNDPEGNNIVITYNLDLAKLKSTLCETGLLVVNGPLVDSTDSIVDAIAVPGLILLDKAEWKEMLGKYSSEVYYLVLHEMLRSAGYGDRDYEISASLGQFKYRNY